MSLPVEEVDNDGRAIFFKCPADISKAVAYDTHSIDTQERVNRLHEQQRFPYPKFRGYIYNYSPFLTLCSRGQNGLNKIKQKIDYRKIRAAYSCEMDPNVVIMVVDGSMGRCQIRVFRFPTPIMGTKFRYVIDQLQLNPIQESLGPLRRTINSSSSFSTPVTEPSDNSVTSAAHYYHKSAAFGQAMGRYYEEDDEPKLPRVQPFAFGSMQRSQLYQSNRSLSRHKSTIFDKFDPNDYEVHRPSRAGSRTVGLDDDDDGRAIDYGYEPRSSQMLVRRQQPRRLAQPVAGKNFNSRSMSRNSTRLRNLVYLEPEYAGFDAPQYERVASARPSIGRVSRAVSVPRRYDLY